MESGYLITSTHPGEKNSENPIPPPLLRMLGMWEKLLLHGPKSEPGTSGQKLQERKDVNQNVWHVLHILFYKLYFCEDLTNEPWATSLELIDHYREIVYISFGLPFSVFCNETTISFYYLSDKKPSHSQSLFLYIYLFLKLFFICFLNNIYYLMLSPPSSWLLFFSYKTQTWLYSRKNLANSTYKNNDPMIL